MAMLSILIDFVVSLCLRLAPTIDNRLTLGSTQASAQEGLVPWTAFGTGARGSTGILGHYCSEYAGLAARCPDPFGSGAASCAHLGLSCMLHFPQAPMVPYYLAISDVWEPRFSWHFGATCSSTSLCRCYPYGAQLPGGQ